MATADEAFAPHLPEALTRLAFGITYRGRRLHHGQRLLVTPTRQVMRAVPTPPVLERPTQPLGRAPARRSATPTKCESKERSVSAAQAGT